MKLALVRIQGTCRAAVVDTDGATLALLDFQVGETGLLPLLEALAAGGALPPVDATVPMGAVRFSAPLGRPRRNVFCIGLNYRGHAAELAARGFNGARCAEDLIPAAPVVFSKVPESVIDPGATIEMPLVSGAIDYEAELAVVIGRGGKNIARERALEHVAGYTIVNDVTARDLQKRHQQWLLCKSCDSFCPMGPWIVTADAFDPAGARVRLWVNEELRQDGNTSDLVFDVPAIIAALSATMTLLPGDVIATGTPAGVGMAFDPPRWLRAGDVVRIEIEGIGELVNPVG